MHEYSIVLALLDQVREQAEAHDAISVERIRLRVGEQSGVEIELLETAYDLAKTGTLCEKAEIELIYSSVRWQCPVCQMDISKGSVLRCTLCDEPARMIEGDEILLEQLEMEIP